MSENEQPQPGDDEGGDDVGAAELNDREAREVLRRTSPSVTVLHETVRRQGNHELERTAGALLLSSLAAGLSMGFSMLVPALIRARLGETAATELLAGLGYAFGFVLVILGRQQLFTENTLTAVLPVMSEPDGAKVLKLLRLWGLVLLGNMVGVALFSLAVRKLAVVDPVTQEKLVHMADRLMLLPMGEMFSRGIFAGWLVAILVWLLPAVQHAKVSVIVLVTGMIGIGEFSHVVAGAAEAFYAMFAGHASIGDVLLRFMLPTLAGNVVGGTLIFALVSHVQVRSD